VATLIWTNSKVVRSLIVPVQNLQHDGSEELSITALIILPRQELPAIPVMSILVNVLICNLSDVLALGSEQPVKGKKYTEQHQQLHRRKDSASLHESKRANSLDSVSLKEPGAVNVITLTQEVFNPHLAQNLQVISTIFLCSSWTFLIFRLLSGT
jgi:hypothetical protein